jgi:hypothetical protein
MHNEMSFYVFVGPRVALVHSSECSYCNDGRGIRRVEPIWLGPFSVLADAMRQAKERHSSVKLCGHCDPDVVAGDEDADKAVEVTDRQER